MAGSLSTRTISASPGPGARSPHSSRSPRLSRAAPLPISSLPCRSATADIRWKAK